MKVDREFAHLESFAVDDLSDPVSYREVIRQATANLPPSVPVSPDIKIEERHAQIRSGNEAVQLSIRVYRPIKPARLMPVMLYIHGGGFVCGDLETGHITCVDIVTAAQCCVVSVAYRLAPEYPFPVPMEDCYGTLLWIWDTADELGVDRTRIGVGGASAGGALAAAVALAARDRGGPSLVFQMLSQPSLDDRLNTESMRTLEHALVASPVQAKNIWRHYLGDSHLAPPYAAPARSTNLTNLPRAYVLLGQCDIFRDEAIDYARALNAANVPVELHQFAGAVHGFDVLTPEASISRRARAEIAAYVADAFSRN